MTITWNTTPVRLGSLPADQGDGLALVQQRVALFAAWMSAVGATFLALNFAMMVLLDGPPQPLARLSQLFSVLVVFVVWLVARRRRALTARALAALDASSLIVVCLACSVMGVGFGGSMGAFTGLLACVNMCLARAVVVPTTVRRTAWTTGLALAPVPVAAAFALAHPGIEPPAFAIVAIFVVWCLAALGLAILSSRVVYGLQEKVREAQQLGQYTLEDKIGAGGMGEVYRARHALLRRPTAIKLLSGEQTSPRQLRRFEQEVQLTSTLTHPNTIVIYDYGHTPDGTFYYAMEYLDGLDLASLVRNDGPQPPERVIHLLLQICAALGEAHGVGLIHRDIKPENIVISVRGGVPDFVKVLDFGLVRHIDPGHDAALTSDNLVAGTPHYMSPEAIIGRDVDARSDLYAVGCVGYYLLTGSLVFEGDSIMQVCGAHLHQAPEPPSKRCPGAPADLDAVLLACLAKDPLERPRDADHLSEMLAACEHSGRWTRARGQRFWDDRPARGPRDPKLENADTVAALQVELEHRVP